MSRLAAFLLLASMSLSGCAQPGPQENALSLQALDGTRWSLQTWSDRPESEALRRIDLSFDGARLGGEGPCNIYNAEFKLDDGKLHLGPIGATKRGCEPEVMQLERAWFDALAMVNAIRLEGAELVLLGANGLSLRFVRAENTAGNEG